MSDRPVAVVAALREEMGALAARLVRAGGGRGERQWVLPGSLAGRSAVLAVTGDGRTGAERGLTAVLDRHRPAAVVVIGVAGGLSPDLEAGDLVAVAEVVDAAGGGPLAADPGWLARALATRRAAGGRLLSVERVVATAAAKDELWRALGRPSRQAVDVESAVYARLAAARGIPCVVLKAISDSAGENLPLPFDRLAAADGAIHRLRVVGSLAARPRRLPAVLALRRRVLAAADELAVLVEELLR